MVYSLRCKWGGRGIALYLLLFLERYDARQAPGCQLNPQYGADSAHCGGGLHVCFPMSAACVGIPERCCMKESDLRRQPINIYLCDTTRGNDLRGGGGPNLDDCSGVKANADSPTCTHPHDFAYHVGCNCWFKLMMQCRENQPLRGGVFSQDRPPSCAGENCSAEGERHVRAAI